MSLPPSIQPTGLIRGPNPWVTLSTAPDGSEVPLFFLAGDATRMAVGGHIQTTGSPLAHSLRVTENEVTIGTFEQGNTRYPFVTHHWRSNGQWTVTGAGTLIGGPGELFDLNVIDLAVIQHIMNYAPQVFDTPVSASNIALTFRRNQNLDGSFDDPFVTVTVTSLPLSNEPAPRTGARFRLNGELIGVW